MAAVSTRRLPGFRFENAAPPIEDTLPRMDVAVFVGFAASGPLQIPVAIESVAQFQMIFGDDTRLAWDPVRGEWVSAHLASAVRAFFRNGGRRCWTVRVASTDAVSNQFPIPGLARLAADGTLSAAVAPARSEGSWSDDVLTGAAISSQALDLTPVSFSDLKFVLGSGSSRNLAEGDLVRVTLPAQNYTIYFVVSAIQQLNVTGSRGVWFQGGAKSGLGAGIATLPEGGRLKVLGTPVFADDGTVTVDLQADAADAFAPGFLVKIDFGGQQLWLTVDSANIGDGEGSPPGRFVRLAGQGVWKAAPPSMLPSSQADAERLTFELWAGEANQPTCRLTGLGFAPAHPRFWGELPLDQNLYQDQSAPANIPAPPPLWVEASRPRFPLAGPDASGGVYLPIGMPALPTLTLGPLPLTAAPLVRDGLRQFGAELFLDPKLRNVGLLDLMLEADFLRFQSPAPRRLTGIHAALAVDEATIVAAPDAVHQEWEPAPEAAPAAPGVSAVLVSLPPADQFHDCGIQVPAAPILTAGKPAADGTFTLFWTGTPGQQFVLEESNAPDYSEGAAIFQGIQTQLTLYGRSQGAYYYRVRAIDRGNTSNWSAGVAVPVARETGFRLKTGYSSAALTEIQQALLRLCAARGDLFGMLAMPDSFREDDAMAHAGRLKLPGIFGYGEANAHSYGAIYHPWLTAREENAPAVLRRTPPDGAACGVLAKRSAERGAWVSPGNEVFRGTVDLTPPIAAERRIDLQQAQINLIRQEPRGFLALSADTLSNDPDLLEINVRRLLILLRRLALREGAAYVFEPNNESFRRGVQAGFEQMMDDLFRRGAFAGTDAATSYQVVTSAALNTPQSVEAGRFIVELKVAPSLPLRFLTIRLVNSGDSVLLVEVQ